jgi:23S rRNA pseudouridine1911/1915/1917 synthase
MVVRPDGRVARTHFEVIGRVASPDRTTIGVELETGRTHQIRVHMAAIGHPIANDPRYGQRNVTSLDRDRLALHAGRLAFVHPATDQLVSFQAPIPADLVALGVGEAASNWLAEGRD